MKRLQKSILWFSVQGALSMVVIGFLVSACSLTGQSASTTLPSIPTKSVQSTVHPQSSTPVASKPTGATKLSNGKPLPTSEIKPLTFNLAYHDAAMDQDVAQIYV
ncbi:MAG TPA: hypothetical protein VKR42_05840, partial [Ktedonobacteraceae bacterium]|nr:hypothetical protein [Ktedonobacteraceae bacterium]